MASCSSLALAAKSLWRRCFSHGGHGVHSPFAFELLTRVVEEKSLYSAFSSIRDVVHRYGRKENDLKLAFLFYRLAAHYPIKRIQVLEADSDYMQELLPLLERATCPSPLEHPYGPYPREDLFSLYFITEEAALTQIIEKPIPAILLIPTWQNLSLKRRTIQSFKEGRLSGIRIDLPTAQLVISSPRFHLQQYKSTL
ncbi:MAG: hypothetical protein ACTTHD_00925 [Porphyromonas endodontalis]|uniref:hypothetical protein n=1 Tax=Porphyromonas endodontalis TaxID=28124 RepID=UPI003F9EDE51